MSKKVENQDLFSGDVFLKTVADVELLLVGLNKLETAFVEVAKANKKILTNSGTKTVEGIRATNEAVVTLNETEKMHQDLQKKKLNLETKLKAARTATAQDIAQLTILTAQQNKINKENTQNTLKLTDAYHKLTKATNAAQAKFKNLAAEFGVNSKQANAARIAFDKLDDKLRAVNNAARDGRRDVGRYGIALDGLRSGFFQFLGAIGITTGIYMFVGAIKDAFNRIREFDKEMQAMAGIAEMTRKKLKPVEQEIKKVSKGSINSSIEVAKLATTLFQLGKSSNDVKMLLRPIDDLSISLRATGEDTAKFLGQTLNAFGKGSASGQEFADIISNIAAKTALDFEGLSESFGYIAPSAKALNITVGKTGAIIGVLNDNGIKAARSGRLMASGFARLVDKGLSLDQALAKINESTNKTSTAAELFGTEAFTLGLILADNVEKTKRLADEFDNLSEGALAKLKDEQLKSVDAQLKVLNSTWESFILSIENGQGVLGNAFKGMITGMIKVLNLFKTYGILVGEARDERLSASAKEDVKEFNEFLKVTNKLKESYQEREKTIASFLAVDLQELEQLRAKQAALKTVGERYLKNKEIEDKSLNESQRRRKEELKLAGMEGLTEKKITSNKIAFNENVKQQAILMTRINAIRSTNIELLKEEAEYDGGGGSGGKKTAVLSGLIEKQQEIVRVKNELIQQTKTETDIFGFKKEADAAQIELDRLLRIVNSTYEEITQIETSLIKDQTQKNITLEIQKSDAIIEQLETNSLLSEEKRKELIQQENDRLAKFIEAEQLKELLAKIDNEAALSKAEFEQRRSGFKSEKEFDEEKTKQFAAIEKHRLSERLRFLEMYANDSNKLEREQLKAQIETLHEFKDLSKLREDLTEAALTVISEMVESHYQKELEMMDKQIAATEKRIDHLKNKAELGQLASQESLAFEEKKQAELEKARAKAQKNQQKAQAFFTVLSTYQGKVNANDPTPLQSTIRDLGVLRALAGQLTGFLEGTDDVGKSLGKPQLKGKDGHIVRVDGKEQIWSDKDRADVGYRTRDEIKDMVGMVDNNMLNNMTNREGFNTGSFILNGLFNKNVIKKLEGIERAVDGIEIPEGMVNIDDVKKIMTLIVKKGNKITTTKSKLF